MSDKICSHEFAVAKAARSGVWDSTVREHAAGCGACKQLVIAVTAMQSLAAGFENDAEMPDGGWLWRKALLERKQAEVDRAQRPLRVAEFAAMPAIIFACAAWVALYGPYIQAQVVVWQTELWRRLWQALGLFAAAAPQFSASRPLLMVLLLATAVMVAAHPLLAEE